MYDLRAPAVAGVVGTAAALRCCPLKDKRLQAETPFPISKSSSPTDLCQKELEGTVAAEQQRKGDQF